ERQLVADDQRRAVAVQPRRIRRQPDDRPPPVLTDDRPFVVAHPQPLRQPGMPANEASGGVKQPTRLTIRRRREQYLRPAGPVHQLVERYAASIDVFPFLRATISTTDRQSSSASRQNRRCHGSSFNGCPSQRSSDWVS